MSTYASKETAVTYSPREGPLQEAERLALLFRISQTFNSSLDFDQVLNLVMDEVIAATRAERGFLMLGGSEEGLSFRAARGLDQNTIDEPESQVSMGVIERVAREKRPMLTSNAQDEDWLSDRKSVAVLGLRSVLCVPLLLKGVTQGVIYVDNRIQAGIFNQADLELMRAIAASAAVAIENARLYQVAVEKGRLEREIQLALEVQTRLLSEAVPQLKGWDIATCWIPARQVSGDFYDFISSNQEQLCLAIADVSDKGMPAALYMALTRSVIRASLLHAASPAEGITYANRLICNDAAYGMFVTLFYALINPQTGEMQYVNAGHNPPLHYRTRDGQLARLTRTGMALGIDDTIIYEQHSVHVDSGDLILFYTDGLTEAINQQNQEFGEARLKATLLEHKHATASEIVSVLQDSIASFAGNNEPFDDITMVVARRL